MLTTKRTRMRKAIVGGRRSERNNSVIGLLDKNCARRRRRSGLRNTDSMWTDVQKTLEHREGGRVEVE